ncbi:MAG TPA: ubiquinone/menaquinone biosynthesis methyltransferase [Gemmatimonadales bacterium]|jgi:demethylmenaquinone methyltransferase/2-methoxy-6-polyprenyl-1,4-benzoquinol methylase
MKPTPSAVVSSGGDGKRSYVKAMFTAIAPRYDLLNHVLSLNFDRRWRRQAVDRLEWDRVPHGRYLDACAGTLDLAAELAARPGFQGHVVGADFVVPMLRLGRAKSPAVRPVGADALMLPFPTAGFDGCMVGFGVRNLIDLEAGLREMKRVLRPGARLVILEFGTPVVQPIRWVFRTYFDHVLPHIGRWVSKHKEAYSYLPQSVASFTAPDRLAQLMRDVGFRDVRYVPLTFGIAWIHWGARL